MRRLLWALALAAGPAEAAPGPLAATDLASAQRGYLVYAQVCSACHSIRQLTYADLGGLGLSTAQVRAIAAAHRITDGTDPAGRPLRRPARPDDHLPQPFASPEAAAAANNGAVPPDMSRLAITLPGGAARIARILTGYGPAPAGLVVPDGSYANRAEPDGLIAMPPPLLDDQVGFADGTPATVPQMAHDAASFLDWAAHPHQTERRRVGVSVLLYLFLMAVLVFILKRRVWSDVQRTK